VSKTPLYDTSEIKQNGGPIQLLRTCEVYKDMISRAAIVEYVSLNADILLQLVASSLKKLKHNCKNMRKRKETKEERIRRRENNKPFSVFVYSCCSGCLNTFFFNLSTSSQTEKWFCGWNLVALIISC
jgi:hypothetical protein